MQQKSLPTIEECSVGTQVMYRWAVWQKTQASNHPFRVAVLRKGTFRLVIHQYGEDVCGVLKLADSKPKVRDFREWREPLTRVILKLAGRGWLFVSDSGEVSHVSSH